MERAGAAAFKALCTRWPEARRIAVVCGTGNNGGDGYVLARLARAAESQVELFQVGDPERLKGDALHAAEAYAKVGGHRQAFSQDSLGHPEVVVDALFGTGLEREVTGIWRQAIEAINACGRHACGAQVLAIDVPSGLHSDTGMPLGEAAYADVTVSFIGLKVGMFTGRGPDYCGTIVFDDLQVPRAVIERVAPAAQRILSEDLKDLLEPRRRSAHKGHHGHVLVVGGERGMAGAVRMAGEAAARVGAGLVSLATRPEHAAAVGIARPELMCHGIARSEELNPLLGRASVIALGPGLGQSEWSGALFEATLNSEKPKVIDADALNWLAQHPVSRADWVLTPHPGEAARLLKCSAAEVQAERFAAIEALGRQFGGTCVLKGAGTLVRAPDGSVAVCDVGNPGMATGGMGDVLTGVIAGLIAQGLSAPDAARAGVYVHGAAGDRAAAEGGERGLMPLDLMPHLRRLINP
jgi:yjeF C-terminal region, hydroxyethylthiazole kinase-related/yjeF N-terminal region